MRDELSDIYELEPSQRVLVEASAGTGKTYTIVGIFIRLMFEWNLEAEQILAVTFSRKSTAELKQRILERLRDCLKVAESGVEQTEEGEDPFLIRFFQQLEDRDQAVMKLKRAIRNFDDIQVFTIHGFCQKILQEEALAAGTPFESDLQPGEDLWLQAAEDFWRVFIDKHSRSDAGKYIIKKLLSFAQSPSELIGKNGLQPLLLKPYGQPEGNELGNPVAFAERILSLRNRCESVWREQMEEIYEILENNDIRNFSRVQKKLTVNLQKFFDDQTYSVETFDKMERLTSSYLYDNHNLKTNGSPTQHHEFFDLWQQYVDEISTVPRLLQWIVRQASEDIKIRRERYQLSDNYITYDDLLKQIQGALKRKHTGPELAAKLRRRYPVALVDEFQDTDPLQYDIFSRIYPKEAVEKSSLMMIGDPKQAIYGFRGADLHTYFRARKEGVQNEYTLKHNYRSSVRYIKAVNALFSGAHQTFIEKEISYESSSPGRPEFQPVLQVPGKNAESVRIVGRRGVETNKTRAVDFSFGQTVRAVIDLLDRSGNKPATLGDQIVKAGDIAILVNSNKHAYDLQQRLKKSGVDSVTQTDQSIFESREAGRLATLMNAVINPADRRAVNDLLVTGFYGFDLAQIAATAKDDERRSELVEELYSLQEIWRSRGFFPMFYNLAYRREKLLSFTEIENTERTITNLFHLAELCSGAEKEKKLGPIKLHSWLIRQMRHSTEDEKELQIESDQHLVKIMTIHASKGLQFPVVICPTLWLGYEPVYYKNKNESIIEYHHPETENLRINYEFEPVERRLAAEVQASVEQVSEDVRKAYVALTRARVASIIIWATHSNSNVSGLGAALTGRQSVLDAINNRTKVKENSAVSDDSFFSRFRELREGTEGAIAMEIVEDGSEEHQELRLSAANREPVVRPEYRGRDHFPVQRATESFSSIAGHGSGPDGKDRDEITDVLAELIDRQGQPPGTDDAKDLFSFPKGANAGNVVHKIFEHEEFDFTKPDSVAYGPMIGEILRDHQIETEWTDVLQKMLGDVIGSDIPGLRLDRVQIADQIREMEFHFPSVSADKMMLLRQIRGGVGEDVPEPGPNRFLKGFIDLIVRQNGRYFIIDYKSNYLGDKPEDYSRENLKEAIRSASYDLQYHLYTLALKKYLESADPAFHYNDHFAGVAYLFVRGMRAGSSNGVWFHKPDIKTIKSLEETVCR